MTRVKICGMAGEQDIGYANTLKPDYIGFVFAPDSRRYITPARAAVLREKLQPGIIPVGVFVNEPLENICGLLDRGVIEMVQLHGQEDEAYVYALRKRISQPVSQAFSIKSHQDLERAVRSKADYILLDNGPGGTGETFDWSLLEGIHRPYFLAGGLHEKNVRLAVERLEPYGVDVSSGVETDGRKDFEKMRGFLKALEEIDQELKK